MTSSAGRGGTTPWAVPAATLLLAVLHFLLRPFLTEWWGAPHLLVAAVLVASLGFRAGAAAASGFVLGVLEESVALGPLGPLAIVFAVAGYLGARSWDLFFTDTRLFLPLYLVVGAWGLIVVKWWIVSGDLTWSMIILKAPLGAALTAAAAVPAARWSLGPAA